MPVRMFLEGFSISWDKIFVVEIKSSGIGKYESLTEFRKKYSEHVKESNVLSQKDIGKEEDIKYIQIYLASFLCG